ncbi:MAG: peptide deformylase [Deltaproteobacteria bacterium]|jgi:peptide deformylase|nr:peptide deformylase [Deltaproteobacteria bacterium]
MSDMKIYTYPEPVLKRNAEPVENIDEGLQEIIDQMLETMYAAPGIGLAANQVGVLKRVIVFDGSPREEGSNPRVLINPEIVAAEGSIRWDEACLSVPDYTAEVSRKSNIRVKGLDRDGNPLELEAKDLLAVCLQHEIDHLDGILFIDRISSLKRALYKKKLKKKEKGKSNK